MSIGADITEGMARALWVTSYADYADEHDDVERAGAGEDWDDVAPDTPDGAIKAARELETLFEQSNGGASIDALFGKAIAADGNKKGAKSLARDFGFSLAMQALGHGVSWFDDHEEFQITFPMFECHYDGDVLEWSGRPRTQQATTKRNPDKFDVPGVTNPAKKTTYVVRKSGEKHGSAHLVCRIDNEGNILDTIGPFSSKAKAEGAAEYLASQPYTLNPAHLFTEKGERMYEEIKAGYGTDPRAAEIAARTVMARSKEVPGLLRVGRGLPPGVPSGVRK